ncbi:MAG: hypothetical protein ACR2P8_08900 [Myxococcota bacterium]
MVDFPSQPMAPAAFLESWYPEAFAAADTPAGADALDLRLGIHLAGEGGGEWVFHIAQGKLAVLPGSREESAFTFVQSVEDWQGALWSGSGGAIGKGAATLFRPGAAAATAAAAGPQLAGAPSLEALAELEQLQGLLRMVVTEGPGADWAVGFKLGPGAIPETATTTVSITTADAQALETGELDQMQAIQMQVAARAAQDESS